ncbi:MAG: ABC transporter ATP-binding protein [Actinomycetota bacterium]|nr:ABC transporter ATP-binding protein [Actinomycetota bacterium]
MSGTALSVSELGVHGPSGPIVADFRLDVRYGETVAIVGESGSGKSITARALAGLLPPGLSATGSLTIGTDAMPLAGDHPAWTLARGRRITLLPQDPFTSLSPRHRCGRQIAMALRGSSRADRAAAVLEALDEVGLPHRVADQYPFQLSGGMRQRVAMAAALITRPDVLIADEATTALDVTTQREILDLLERIQDERNMGLILITHDLGVAKGRAQRLTVMYAGRAIERGDAASVVESPAHPYTRRLLACDPPLDATLRRLPTIPGSVPRLAQITARCSFADRCDLATDHCREEEPQFVTIGPGREAACFRTAESGPPSGELLISPVLDPVADSGPPPAATLRVRNLAKSFGHHVALQNVDIDVMEGESLAIVGESGSGKTTLARIIVGLERADSGTVEFPLANANWPQIVFQDPYSALNPSLTVGSSLRDALRAGDGDTSSSEVAALLDMVGLPASYASRRPRFLSGGERQRVAIARALAPKPRLLICDEAVSSLDVSVQAQILNLIADIREQLGLSVLFISHDLAVVRQVAERVYVLFKGRVVEHGRTVDVLGNPADSYTKTLMASVPSTRQ